MSDRSRLLLLALAQTAALLAMIALHQWRLETGTEVVLETEPVDPRSLFQGDYVVLRYRAAHLRTAILAGDDTGFVVGDSIYVVLQSQGPLWQPVAVYRRWPEASAASGAGAVVVLRGRIDSVLPDCPTPDANCPESLEAVYGIETYFVPEGTGRAIERPGEPSGPRPDGPPQLAVRVAIDRFGIAAIIGLTLDRRPLNAAGGH